MLNTEHTIDDIEVIPPNLYKYYKFDANYNKRRLMGEVYFSSPLKFNDPLDSQLPIQRIKRLILGCNISDANICGLLSIIKDDKHLREIKVSKVETKKNSLQTKDLDLAIMLEKYNDLIRLF